MKDIDLTIIIPVYNVEKYLEKCLDSILKIENINFEIILINDGSTDNSGIICEKYKKKYNRVIRYFQQENQGLSESRNNGIKNAQGEYIYFIDSDDYIETELFSKVFYEMKKNDADITYFGYYYESDNYCFSRYSYKSTPNKIYNSNDFLKNELKQRNLPAAVCFGIYKKSLIINNKIFFQKGLLHEDERWSPQVLLKAKKIYTTDDVIYHYIQRENSIMHKRDKTQNGIDLVATAEFLESITNNIEEKKLKKLIRNKQAMLYMRGTVVGKLYRKNYIEKINRYFPIIHSTILVDKIKSVIYLISPTLYYYVAKIVKGD